jgi:hypothetical protein
MATTVGWDICAAWLPGMTAPYEEAEEVLRCVACREALPEGNGVVVDADLLCRCCHHEALEASREDLTARVSL